MKQVISVRSKIYLSHSYLFLLENIIDTHLPVDVNECEEPTHVNCSGHGTCVDGINSRHCECDHSYAGTDCEIGEAIHCGHQHWVNGRATINTT